MIFTWQGIHGHWLMEYYLYLNRGCEKQQQNWTHTENRLVVARGKHGVGDGQNDWGWSSNTNSQLQISHVNVMYSTVTIVNSTVVHIWKMLIVYLKTFHHKIKIVTMYGNGC